MLKLDYENFIDRLMDFAMWSYDDSIKKMRKKYPYKRFPNKERHIMQSSLWAVCKVINPATGITIVDEFVNRFKIDSKLRSTILQLKEIEYDTFGVIEHTNTQIMAASRTGKGIISIQNEESVTQNLVVGAEFEGMVYPYRDNLYRVIGGLIILNVEFATQRDLGPNSAHTNDPHGGGGLLDTLRGITDSNLEYACDCLGIDPSRLGRERMMKEIVKTLTSHKLRKVLKTLTPKSLECLSYIALDKGGYVTNSELSKRFGRELNNMIDELYGVCLVVMMATDRNATRPHSVGIAPDLLVAMYRFKCLGLKRWHPKP